MRAGLTQGLRALGFAALAIIPFAALRLLMAHPGSHALGNGLAMVGGGLNAAVYCFLLAVVLRSLLPGNVPAITRIARRTRGGYLPDALVGYTRRVTIAWALFCGTQLITSALLLCFAPLRAWIFFITMCNLPLLLAMFVGEYAYRLIRYRQYKHESLADMMRAWRGLRALGKGEP